MKLETGMHREHKLVTWGGLIFVFLEASVLGNHLVRDGGADEVCNRLGMCAKEIYYISFLFFSVCFAVGS